MRAEFPLRLFDGQIEDIAPAEVFRMLGISATVREPARTVTPTE